MKNDIKLAAVSLPGKDDKFYPDTQITFNGSTADAVSIYAYGTHANAPVDSHFLLFSLNGQAENKAGIAFNPELRQKNLKPGEVVHGNFVTGSTVFYDEDGNIVVNCEKDEIVTIKGASTVNITGNAAITIGGEATIDVTGNTTLTTPLATVDGNLTVTGDLTVTRDTILSATVTSNGKDISNTHKHSGVTAGGANTGNPV